MNLNKDAESWARVKPEAIAAECSAVHQANVMTMALQDIAKLHAEVSRLRSALQFYVEEWVANGDGDPETPGLSRSWLEPSDHLLQDEGRKAQEALK